VPSDQQPRTVLAALVAASDRTHEEHVVEFNRLAARLGERATLSVRQFERWLVGELNTLPRPTARRVAEALWGKPIHELLGPLAGTPPLAKPEVEAPLATINEWVSRTGHASRDHAAMAAAGGVDHATLEQLHAEVHRLAHAYASTPPLLLLADLMRTRDLAYELQAHTRRPGQLTELLLVTGQVCGLAATTAFDIGQRHAAEDHARAAWTYAEMIDHYPLRAWSRSVQATIAFWSDQPKRGLEYVASGLRFISTGPAAARLQAIGARAWGMLGATEEARQALHVAADVRGHAAVDELNDIGGEFSFNPARHALCAGAVYLELGDGSAAASAATEALHLYQNTPVGQRRWAVEYGARMDLATAFALRDDLEGAEEALVPTLELDRGRRTARLAQRLTALRSAVEQSRFAGSPIGRRITGNVSEFIAGSLTHSGRKALPAGH